MDYQRLCYGCFLEKAGAPCPRCGFDPANYALPASALPLGTVLAGRYLTGKVLGAGGFGVTYLGLDLVLQVPVAIKEYLPSGLAVRATDRYTMTLASIGQEDLYRQGADRFLEEARLLARFRDVPGIVAVQNYFRENNTAYFVMDYIDGVSLKEYVRQNGGRLSLEEALSLTLPVMNALSQVHAQGLLHRDISPDNIFITKDHRPILLDFGAARAASGGRESVSVILKHGFAPTEQYSSHGNQGPWTDVYSMGALLYNILSGSMPEDSVLRSSADNLRSLRELGVDLPPLAEGAILKALSVRPEDRFQTMAAFARALTSYRDQAGGGTVRPQPPKPPLPKDPTKPSGGAWQRLLAAIRANPGLRFGLLGGAALVLVLAIALPLLPGGRSSRDETAVSGGGALPTAVVSPLPAPPSESPAEIPASSQALTYDESGAQAYFFPEGNLSFYCQNDSYVEPSSEEKRVYLVNTGDGDASCALMVEQPALTLEQIFQSWDDSLSSKENFQRGETLPYEVNGLTYSGVEYSYTQDGTAKTQLVLARSLDESSALTVVTLKDADLPYPSLLGLVAGSLQAGSEGIESLAVGDLDGVASYLYPSQYSQEDAGQIRRSGEDLFPYVFVRNHLSTYTTDRFLDNYIEDAEEMDDVSVSEKELQLFGGRWVTTLTVADSSFTTIYVSLPAEVNEGIYTFSLHSYTDDEEGMDWCRQILTRILQTFREDPSIYSQLGSGQAYHSFASHGIALQLPEGANWTENDETYDVNIELNEELQLDLCYRVLAQDTPLYSLADVEENAKAVANEFGDGFSSGSTYEEEGLVTLGAHQAYSLSIHDGENERMLRLYALEPENGYGCLFLLVRGDRDVVEGDGAQVYESILNGLRLEGPVSTDCALLVSEDVSAKFIYDASLLQEEPELLPERDGVVAIAILRLEGGAVCYVEDAEGYANSAEEALDTVGEDILTNYPDATVNEDASYTFGGNEYLTREYVSGEGSSANRFSLACTELNGRLVLYAALFPSSQEAAAQRMTELVLCSLRGV